ncbi:MAG: cytidylate kinase [Bradymonadia bacterium]|jgi:cytidylate kinase
MIVAIDGPAGAGKSTAALLVADVLGYQLISTGALYRAVAKEALDTGIALDEANRLAEIAAALRVAFEVVDGTNRVRVADVDLTDALRTPQVSSGASVVSAIPQVRDALTELQRDYGRTLDVVMEGRDIGTVIFPDAHTKVFLTASLEERAKRRLIDLEAAGEETTIAEVLADIQERDDRDTNRPVAPLRPAEGSVIVDATVMSIEEVVDTIVGLAKQASS